MPVDFLKTWRSPWSDKMPDHPERRKLSRLPLAVPLQIAVGEAPEILFGQTHNVSAQGIFFRTTSRLNLGQAVDCVLVLPENLTLASQPILVGCKGSVVRVDESSTGESYGIAVEVNSYDFSGAISFRQAAGTGM
jgi:PilZ domain